MVFFSSSGTGAHIVLFSNTYSIGNVGSGHKYLDHYSKEDHAGSVSDDNLFTPPTGEKSNSRDIELSFGIVLGHRPRATNCIS